MKVLNVNMSLDPVTGGGTAERTFQISRFLSQAGIECTVLTTDVGLTKERIEAIGNTKVIALPCLFKRFYIPRFSYKTIKSIIAESDIIHLMNHWTFINTVVYLISKRLNKPYIICPAGALPIYGRSKLIKKLYNWVVGNKIIRNADKHIAISKNEISQFQEYGVRPDRVTIIPNGINIDNFQSDDSKDFRLKYGLNKTSFIMFVGRLNSIKGPDLLLRAFCNVKGKLQDFHLVFAGPDGGMLSELKEMVVRLGGSGRVHFTGYIGGEEKSQAYHAADLLVIPSRQEAMSIVVLEAGITGTPVLITNQCGFDEIAKIDGGKVVPASVEGLENGLFGILKNHDRLKSRGENLRKYVNDNYSWRKIIEKYIDLYRQVLRSKK